MIKLLTLGVAISVSLLAVTGTQAAKTTEPYIKQKGDICYNFNSQGLLGEWEEELLVSKKKLTIKQAADYMKKHHGMSDIYDADVLPDDECEAAIISYGLDVDGNWSEEYVHFYKEAQATKKAK